MPANRSAVHPIRPPGEADTGRREDSLPPRSTEDLQARRSLFRPPRPDRAPAPSDPPRMDWLQALIVAGGAAVIAYHLGFFHGQAAQPTGRPED